MLGGDEDPCIDADILIDPKTAWRKAGNPCPRIELLPQNAPAVQAINYILSEELRPGWPSVFEAEADAAGLDPEGRRALLGHISAALHDGEVIEIRRQAMERAMAESRARAKRGRR